MTMSLAARSDVVLMCVAGPIMLAGERDDRDTVS